MEKVCTQCGLPKDAEFDFHLLLKGSDKRRAECKSCGYLRHKNMPAETKRKYSQNWWKKHRAEGRQKNTNWHRNNPEKVLDKNFWARFKIRTTDFRRMVEAQDGLCLICHRPPKKGRLTIDHDHACCPGEICCGKCIRGLLCIKCNALLGNAEDNSETLDSAKEYLRRYAKINSEVQGQAGRELGPISTPS